MLPIDTNYPRQTFTVNSSCRHNVLWTPPSASRKMAGRCLRTSVKLSLYPPLTEPPPQHPPLTEPPPQHPPLTEPPPQHPPLTEPPPQHPPLTEPPPQHPPLTEPPPQHPPLTKPPPQHPPHTEPYISDVYVRYIHQPNKLILKSRVPHNSGILANTEAEACVGSEASPVGSLNTGSGVTDLRRE
nr:bromodomain-containing protein 4-like [Procambarus clarkii]